MTTKTAETDTRYPRSGVEHAIRSAMDGADYAHRAVWTEPDSCRCRTEGKTCLDVQARTGECQGFITEVPVSPDRALTADILITALPAPDAAGTVSGEEVAAAIFATITDRIGWHPVWPDSLAKRLAAAFADLEDTGEADSGRVPASAVPVSVLACQWCSGPIPLARGPKARYCRNSHRVSAHRAKKRQQANAGASPGR
jgi:hypothetical protein